MAATNLGTLLRPNTVSIFAGDPASKGKVVAFLLKDVAVPVPGRVRLDLMRQVSASSRATAARSPVERVVADNIRMEPRTVTVTGQLSATPLGVLGVVLGSFGSIVRRDLRELAKLRRIQERREPVVLVTPGEVFSSMSMSIDESHVGDHRVELTLTFEEIRIVSPLSLIGELDLNAMFGGAASAQQVGGQPTELVTAPAGVAGGTG